MPKISSLFKGIMPKISNFYLLKMPRFSLFYSKLYNFGLYQSKNKTKSIKLALVYIIILLEL